MSRSFADEGLSVSGYLTNAAEPGALEQLVSDVEQVGPIDTMVYNLGAQIYDPPCRQYLLPHQSPNKLASRLLPL